MIGEYTLKGNDFIMTIIVRSNLTVHKVKGSFFGNGDLQSAQGYAYKPIAGKDSLLLQSYRLMTRNDSTIIEQKTGDNLKVYRYVGKGMLHLGINPYIFYMHLLAHYAPKKIGESVSSTHFVLDKGVPFTLKRIDRTTLKAGSSLSGPFTIYLNGQGKVASIDAIGSSWNVKGNVVAYLNMDSLIHANAVREQQYGALAEINKLDSLQTTIGAGVVKIKYSRPSMRGRVIFGEVVPWNRFWRTGANAATKISISTPLYFNNQELAAGEYSLFTMPSQNGWTMMFNKEANIWGTRYNPANDVLKVPMQVEQIKEPVEVMTIEIEPVDKGGIIHIIWEKTKASLPFTVRK